MERYFREVIGNQLRWSPRGHILKSLALASKVKSLALASRPQVLENWPVLGSRTALVFELLKFCGVLEKSLDNVFCGDRLKNFCEDLFFFFLRSPEKILGRPFFYYYYYFFFEIARKIFVKTYFFWRALALVSLALASSIPVLGLERVCPRKGCPWSWIFLVSLASSLVSSTPPLVITVINTE